MAESSFLFVRVDFLSVYTANEGTKTGFNYVICADDSFNCSCHKNVRKENFAANYFQLDKVENLALPRC